MDKFLTIESVLIDPGAINMAEEITNLRDDQREGKWERTCANLVRIVVLADTVRHALRTLILGNKERVAQPIHLCPNSDLVYRLTVEQHPMVAHKEPSLMKRHHDRVARHILSRYRIRIL